MVSTKVHPATALSPLIYSHGEHTETCTDGNKHMHPVSLFQHTQTFEKTYLNVYASTMFIGSSGSTETPTIKERRYPLSKASRTP